MWRGEQDGSWERRTDGALVWDDNARMLDGVVAHDLAVAVGSRFVDQVFRPSFWFAPDGFSWVQAGVDGDLDAQRGAEVLHVCALAEGFLAFGSRATETHDQMLAWTSADGSTWTLVTAGNDAFGDAAARVRGCVGTEGGALVVGSVGEPDRPAAWTSRDGQRFEQVDPDAFTGRRGALVAATVDPTGRAWAVGNAQLDGVWTPLVHRQTDEGTWQRVPLDEEVFRSPLGDESLSDVLVDGTRVLLVGRYTSGVGLWAAPLDDLE